MDYIFFGILSFLLAAIFCLTIINIVVRKKQISKIMTRQRQSDNHLFLKEFFSRNIKSKNNFSQLELRKEKTKVKIIFTDDNKAYWVDNNIFYVASVINGRPDFRNAEKIDTTNMSKNELDKMLVILDNLRRGDTNERGSSGN